MPPARLFAEILLPLPLPGYFTYEVPDELHQIAGPGKRAVVRFGNRKLYTGLICMIHDQPPENLKTRSLISILDHTPICTREQLNFWKWLSEYYLCTEGEVLKAAMPAGLKLESETRVYINTESLSTLGLSNEENTLLDFIEHNQGVNIRKLETVIDHKKILPLLKSLAERDLILLEEKLRPGYTPRTEVFLGLHPRYLDETSLHSLLDGLDRAPKQKAALLAYLEMADNPLNPPEVTKKQLAGTDSSFPAAIQTLIGKNILVSTTKQVCRDKPAEDVEEMTPNRLSPVQEAALVAARKSFGEKKVAALHGITSSGKTEIYIHLIREQIRAGKQVLYLLPEIALTAQIINRLRRFFGRKVGVYHSRISDQERVEVWKDILENKQYKLIVGARSSVFLPFRDLGLIIVDEEHENSYKQYDPAPRYHARDSAIYLAGLHKANVLLGTATPSFETYYNARSGKYGLVELRERFREIELPEILVADTKEAYRQKKMKSHFTPLLLESMKSSLEGGEQVILFQNRRGYSLFVQCQECGWIPGCSNCDVTLTYHSSPPGMVCHYCGFTAKPFSSCSSCGSPGLLTRGFGTEKVENEIAHLFPGARVARLDLDSARSRKNYEKILSDFENRKTDILVGTQMISKGLDFDHVGLVGIMNADNMLNFPDFRAFERSFQLMAQVSGRAGRKHKRGKVIIQTANPRHPVIRDILQNDYLNFYRTQLAERREFHYPPYYRLIRISIRHRRKETASRAALWFLDRIRHEKGCHVLGPITPLVSRIQKYSIREILIKHEKGNSGKTLKDKFQSISHELIKIRDLSSVQLVFDVDPQ